MNFFNSLTFLALMLLLIFLGPWLTILALNQVFGLSLVADFWTWLSVFWLQSLLVVRVNTK